ncbi:MAG: OsmC family protein [Candidatus Limnocylindrales bacterium]
MRKTGRLVWRGGNVVEAESGLGGAIHFDSTRDQAGLRPTEAVVLALAACSAMDIQSILLKKRQVIAAYEMTVEAEQRDEHPQVIESITVVHELDGDDLDVEAVRRSIELSATKYCAVSATLASGDVIVRHGYRVRNASGTHEAEVLTTGPRGAVVLTKAPVAAA